VARHLGRQNAAGKPESSYVKDILESGLNDTAADQLALLIEFHVFHGSLPPFPDAIVASVLSCVPALRSYDEHQLQEFTDLLYRALVRRIGSRAEHVAWQGLN
jgi:hypothetical protein